MSIGLFFYSAILCAVILPYILEQGIRSEMYQERFVSIRNVPGKWTSCVCGYFSDYCKIEQQELLTIKTITTTGKTA